MDEPLEVGVRLPYAKQGTPALHGAGPLDVSVRQLYDIHGLLDGSELPQLDESPDLFCPTRRSDDGTHTRERQGFQCNSGIHGNGDIAAGEQSVAIVEIARESDPRCDGLRVHNVRVALVRMRFQYNFYVWVEKPPNLRSEFTHLSLHVGLGLRKEYHRTLQTAVRRARRTLLQPRVPAYRPSALPVRRRLFEDLAESRSESHDVVWSVRRQEGVGIGVSRVTVVNDPVLDFDERNAKTFYGSLSWDELGITVQDEHGLRRVTLEEVTVCSFQKETANGKSRHPASRSGLKALGNVSLNRPGQGWGSGFPSPEGRPMERIDETHVRAMLIGQIYEVLLQKYEAAVAL